MSGRHNSRAWLQRQKRDIYVRRANRENWRSRAVFKLEQIDRKYHLIRPGRWVIDLGASPGSWTQYLSAQQAKVVACDLNAMEPVAQATFIRGDFTDRIVQDRIRSLVKEEGAPLVVSDMAPRVSGINEVDQNNMVELIEETIDFANRLFLTDGRVLVKVLQGAATQELWAKYRREFSAIKAIKPAASRSVSNETYWLVRIN